jgi:molybdenum cofactor cytidylyltransferase
VKVGETANVEAAPGGCGERGHPPVCGRFVAGIVWRMAVDARHQGGSVGGIVLAAGTSTRMGTNKLLLELDGTSVLRRAVTRTLDAGLDPVVVVLGHEADKVRELLKNLPARTIVNPDYQEGMNASLAAGLRALPPAVTAGVVVLADMPLVTRDMIAGVLDRYRRSGARLVVSEYGGRPAPPVLYDRSLFAELMADPGDGMGRSVVSRHRAEAAVVQWPVTALQDLDVPDDYARISRLLGG